MSWLDAHRYQSGLEQADGVRPLNFMLAIVIILVQQGR